MPATPNLSLPLLAAAQAQKHVTHNEAVAMIDALVHLAVKERGRALAPGDPADGDRYLVGENAAGAFATHDFEIAFFDLGTWRFLAPRAGWTVYVEAEDLVLVHDGAEWRDLGRCLGELANLARLGVGTSADALNRFAAKLNACLFTALASGEGGTGDLRFVLNKAGVSNVLSQLYQRGFSGRAETGLIGDDDFRLRVSADGATWRDAMRVDRASAEVTFPAGLRGHCGAGNLIINGDFSVNQRVFPGGALAEGIYGFDRWKAAAGGCTLTRAADGSVSLNGTVMQVIEKPGLAGELVTVSLENPSAAIGVTVEGASGVIEAGSGRRSLTLTVPPTASGNVTLTLTASGASFARPVLNRGAFVEPFLRLPPGAALMACQRYYAKTFLPSLAPSGALGSAGSIMSHANTSNAILPARWQFPVPMRAVPTLTFYNPSALNANWSLGGVAAVVAAGSATSDSIRVGTATPPSIASGAVASVHAVADAEL